MSDWYWRAFVLSVLLTGLSPLSQAEQQTDHWPPSIDVFTTANRPIRGIREFLHDNPGATLRVHNVDTIERLEVELSDGLPARPDDARREALKRLQQLSPVRKEQLERAVRALAKALQLNVEKIPAIVFDDDRVIYGVTDLGLALQVYQSSQSKDSR